MIFQFLKKLLRYKYILMKKIKYDYIIYHNNCFDGFTGFFLFIKTKLWTPKPFVYPDQPHAKNIPPNIDGKNVIIIDVAYNAKIVKEIAIRANKILFIDHHVSIKNDIKDLNLGPQHTIVYEESESGASLVWKYFYGDKKMPSFVKYVADNDTGKWEYLETLPFMAALEVMFKLEPTFDNLKKWDKLLDEEFVKKMIDKGTLYNEYKDFLIKKSSKKYVLKGFPSNVFKKKAMKDIQDKYIVAVISNTCPSSSLVGKEIANTVDCDFVMLYNYNLNKKRYVVSLRSAKDKTDVGQLAKLLGGGGHKHASAFSFSSDNFKIDDLFYELG